MDHFFQIRSVGRRRGADARGLDGARVHRRAHERARIGLMVGGVHYRQPALWVKAATTLDVLSGGRAWLGIGAAWNQQESRGPRVPVPAARRAVRDARGDPPDRPRDVVEGERGTEAASRAATTGATHLLNSPQSISRPRVADHDRRRRRAEDAPAGRAVRRRHERLRRPRDDPPQVRGAAAALRGGRPRPRRDRALDAPVRCGSRVERRRAARARSRSSTGSASSPTPAPST